MKHVRMICGCGDPLCSICDKSLFVCQVCNSAEAELTKDCVGRRLTLEEKRQVVDGMVDFRDGFWIIL